MRNSQKLSNQVLLTFLMTVCATRATLLQSLFTPIRSGVNVEGTILMQFAVRSSVKCPVWYVLISPSKIQKFEKGLIMGRGANFRVIPSNSANEIVTFEVFSSPYFCIYSAQEKNKGWAMVA